MAEDEADWEEALDDDSGATEHVDEDSGATEHIDESDAQPPATASEARSANATKHEVDRREAREEDSGAQEHAQQIASSGIAGPGLGNAARLCESKIGSVYARRCYCYIKLRSAEYGVVCYTMA